MTKYYVDTGIWIDYYENRKDRFRPLGEWAHRFLAQANEQGNIILYSDAVIDELRNKFTDEQISEILRVVHTALIHKVEIEKIQANEAYKLKSKLKIPFADALHSILARDNDAIMITRDNHFLKLHEIAEIRKPEDVI